MAGAGALLRRFREVSAGPISLITLYIFSPALVLNSLATTEVPTGEIGRIGLFAVAFAAVMYLISLPSARMLALDRVGTSGFQLATLFMNAGNYGLPVALFAFGQPGFDRAIVFFIAQATLAGTLQIYLASRSQMTVKDALLSIARIPLIYATVAGLAVNLSDAQLPSTIGEPVRILGNAAIPSMLMVLGIQLAERFSLEDTRALVTACTLRLVASGGIAYLVTLLLGFEGLTQQVLVVMAAMPTAVSTIIVATEFRARPSFVTSVVVVSTGASLLTLTLLISLVQDLL